MTQVRLLTAEDIATCPDDHELYEGVPRSVAAAPDVSAIAVNVVAILWNHVRSGRLGIVFGADASFRLSRDPDTVYLPDAAFVHADRVRTRDDLTYPFEGALDLAIEVRSPSDSAAELDRKMRCYLMAGTRLGWALDPFAWTVTAYRPDTPTAVLGERETLEANDVLPDLRVAVADLFWLGDFRS